MNPTGPTQSTLVFSPAGQAFSIPLHAAHIQQIPQATATAAMYSPDGTQYFQPVTQIAAQPTGPKITRTDRLEVCLSFVKNQFYSFSHYSHSFFSSFPLKQW